MWSVLILTGHPELARRIEDVLPEGVLAIPISREDLQETLWTVPADLVIAEVSGPKDLDLLELCRSLQASCVLLGIRPEEELWEPDHRLFTLCDFVLKEPLSRLELSGAVERALEKRRLLQKLQALETVSARAAPTSLPQDLLATSHMLKEFARFLSTGFDLSRLTELFLEAVSRLVSPGKMVLLLQDLSSPTYRVHAHRGLSGPHIDRLELRGGQGLPLWFSTEGRILYHEETSSDPLSLEARRDMEMLQSIIVVPLIARGHLVGILGLGRRVTGAPYTQEELETLFTLGGHVAMAIQDIQLHRQMEYQKAYIEQILSGMSSGVVNIDRRERVTFFNRRAGEILGKDVSEMLGEDLRHLPSPLGDMLFETLQGGKTYWKHTVKLLPDRKPLEVSTYPLRNGDEIIGSVMLFDDISDRVRLEEERIRSERLDLLHRVVGWIAHEVKNPLVSIQTFVELLPERYEDPEFREQFQAVMGQEVQRLNGLVEKLVALTEGRPYEFRTGDIRPVLEGVVKDIKEQNKGNLNLSFKGDLPPVRHDPVQLSKAFRYILDHILSEVPPGSPVSVSAGLGTGPNVVIYISSPSLNMSSEQADKLLDPFQKGSLLDLGLCASRKIVEDHRGAVSVEPRAKGIRFTVRLPVSPKEDGDGKAEGTRSGR
ncbi:MAG TPA: GAF domain-containing protein [Candidatus Latescibacteria bacterium]|nr:GAF domain-containing protein [Candidatus Latescibacterota bacterium]